MSGLTRKGEIIDFAEVTQKENKLGAENPYMAIRSWHDQSDRACAAKSGCGNTRLLSDPITVLQTGLSVAHFREMLFFYSAKAVSCLLIVSNTSMDGKEDADEAERCVLHLSELY